MDYKLSVMIIIDEENKEVNHELSSNYTPSDRDSINNCINDLNGKATRFKEDFEVYARLIDKIKGYKPIITRCIIRFTRPDGTIIDELDVTNIQVVKDMMKFNINFSII